MHIFRISFHHDDQIFQLHAKCVDCSELYGFIEVEDLIFDEHTGVVIDPSEERLKSEFKGVNRLFLPLHSVIRIDEMEHKGKNKILDKEGRKTNIMPFPLPGNSPQRN